MMSSSSSSSSSSSDTASAPDISDALKRAQTALAKMQARNHAGTSGRWCRTDTARPHFFKNKAMQFIQRGQLDAMSEHWPMLEGPKELSGNALQAFDVWPRSLHAPERSRMRRDRRPGGAEEAVGQRAP